MDLAEIKEWSREQFVINRDQVDWLIAEVERLTSANVELSGETERFKLIAGNASYADQKLIESLQADREELFGETERLKERANELDGIAYTNGELYNKEYLKREEAEARLKGADSMTTYWRVQYTHVEAERDKSELENNDLRARIAELTQNDPCWYDMSVADAFRMWESDRAESKRYKAALELYADKTRWSRAWGDDEALLYNIREDGGDGWSIAQEALVK